MIKFITLIYDDLFASMFEHTFIGFECLVDILFIVGLSYFAVIGNFS